jgi:ABC-type antimicrobial peptide transport system permease subunit
MALGAGRGRVVVLIVREVGVMMLIGLALGMVLTGVSTRFIAARLYGLSPLDPLTIFSAAGILCFVALISSCIPALRAATVNPTKALRYE